MEYTLQCSGGCTLKVNETSIIAIKNERQELIPLSKIQSFHFIEATLYNGGGLIEFKTAQAAEGSIHWGFGISSNVGATHVYRYKYKELKNAVQIRDYITSYLNKNEVPAPQKNVAQDDQKIVSVVDEIRGLKNLLDEGILTKEEFDAKKKQLLKI